MICSSCKKPINNDQKVIEKIKIQGVEIENVLCSRVCSTEKATTPQVQTRPKEKITVTTASKTALFGIAGALAGGVIFTIISILTRTYFWYAGILITFGSILLVKKYLDINHFIQKIILILITSTVYIFSVTTTEFVLYLQDESLKLFELNPLYILMTIPVVIGFILTDLYQILFLVSNLIIIATTKDKTSII